jgi:hypothetical protein
MRFGRQADANKDAGRGLYGHLIWLATACAPEAFAVEADGWRTGLGCNVSCAWQAREHRKTDFANRGFAGIGRRIDDAG